jgi:hypothetical protein
MNSKRSHEGYFCLDHTASPGLPDEVVVPQGLPPGAGKRLFESSTFTCSHCEVVVVKNPDRSRERAWCKHCDHYICDVCGSELHRTGICYPFKARVADMIDAELAKAASTVVFQSPLLSTDAEQKPAPSSIIVL